MLNTAKQFITDNGCMRYKEQDRSKRYLQKHVETLSQAKLILADSVKQGDTILIDVEGWQT